MRDTRVKPQGKTQTYQRVRVLESVDSTAKVFWQYQRCKGWLKSWRITLIADDDKGITPHEVRSIVKKCRYYKLVLVELALDFSPLGEVDEQFVTRHAVFGKSRYERDRGGPGELRYGSRKSRKLVRCYWKREVNAYRVELELHSALLRRSRIDRAEDLSDVPYVIFPKHVRFVRVSWRRLARYLKRRSPEQRKVILEAARERAGRSLRSAIHLLRRRGVLNVHRFLTPMQINQVIEAALWKWSFRFAKGCV